LSDASGSSVLRTVWCDVLNAVIGKFEDELASLDLGQIEHVIDQTEQMFSVGLKPFEYAEHLLGWLTVSAVRH